MRNPADGRPTGRDARPGGPRPAAEHQPGPRSPGPALDLFERHGLRRDHRRRDRRGGRRSAGAPSSATTTPSGTWCGGSSTPSWSASGTQLLGAPPDEPMMDVLRRAVVATNRFGAGELDELRIRMGLISIGPEPWWPTRPCATPSGARWSPSSWPAGSAARPTTWVPRPWPGPASARPWPPSPAGPATTPTT